MVLHINQTAESGNVTTRELDADVGQHIEVDFKNKLQIDRDGNTPVKFFPLADGMVAQWEDRSYVVLEQPEGEGGLPRQVSMNGRVTHFGQGDGTIDDYVSRVAGFDESPVHRAPPRSNGVPFPGFENKFLYIADPEEEIAHVVSDPAPTPGTPSATSRVPFEAPEPEPRFDFTHLPVPVAVDEPTDRWLCAFVLVLVLFMVATCTG